MNMNNVEREALQRELEALQRRFPIGSTWRWRPGGQSTARTEAFTVANVGFTSWRPVVIDAKGQKWFADGGTGTLERIDTPTMRCEDLEDEIAVHVAEARAELESACRDPENCGRGEYQCGCRSAVRDDAFVPEDGEPLLRVDSSQIEEQSEPFYVVVYDTVRELYGPGCEFGLRPDSTPHIRELSKYGTCKRCNSTPRDRLVARRQNFEFNVDVGEFFLSRSKTGEGDEEYKLLCEFYAKATDHEIDRVWLARCYGQHAFAPTRELAIEALWTKLEVILPHQTRESTLPVPSVRIHPVD